MLLQRGAVLCPCRFAASRIRALKVALYHLDLEYSPGGKRGGLPTTAQELLRSSLRPLNTLVVVQCIACALPLR